MENHALKKKVSSSTEKIKLLKYQLRQTRDDLKKKEKLLRSERLQTHHLHNELLSTKTENAILQKKISSCGDKVTLVTSLLERDHDEMTKTVEKMFTQRRRTHKLRNELVFTKAENAILKKRVESFGERQQRLRAEKMRMLQWDKLRTGRGTIRGLGHFCDDVAKVVDDLNRFISVEVKKEEAEVNSTCSEFKEGSTNNEGQQFAVEKNSATQSLPALPEEVIECYQKDVSMGGVNVAHDYAALTAKSNESGLSNKNVNESNMKRETETEVEVIKNQYDCHDRHDRDALLEDARNTITTLRSQNDALSRVIGSQSLFLMGIEEGTMMHARQKLWRRGILSNDKLKAVNEEMKRLVQGEFSLKGRPPVQLLVTANVLEMEAEAFEDNYHDTNQDIYEYWS